MLAEETTGACKEILRKEVAYRCLFHTLTDKTLLLHFMSVNASNTISYSSHASNVSCSIENG
jgi:hypothetical protein